MLHSLPPADGDPDNPESDKNPGSNRFSKASSDRDELRSSDFYLNRLRFPAHSDDAPSRVDTRLCDQRLARLVAGFITDNNTQAQNAELAGKLTFYSNHTAADLYRREILGEVRTAQRNELIAHAIFPEKPRMAELYLRSKSTNQILSDKQLIELYVNEIYGDNVELKGHAALQIRWARTQLENRGISLPERADAIRAVVRLELREGNGRVYSDGSLARLLGVSTQEVKSALLPYESGLTAQEVRQRQALLTITEKGESQVLGERLVKAIGTLIRIENSLHMEGVVRSISSDEKIAALFGIETQVAEQYARLAPDKVAAYRLSALSQTTPEQRKDALVAEVLSEIEALRHGEGNERPKRLRTTIELSKDFGLSPVAVFKHLRNELSYLDWNYRDERLKRQEGAAEIEKVKSSILDYVQNKINDHREKRTSRIQSWEELAMVFQVQEETIIKVLGELPAGEINYRLEHVTLPGFSSRFASHRSIMTGFVKEELKAYLNREIAKLSSDRELATIFPLSPIEVREQLRDPHLGLKLEELKVRNFVLAASSEDHTADKAFETVIIDTLKEKVRREVKHVHCKQEESPGESGSGLDRLRDRPRGSIKFEGHNFDSIEEAAYAHFLRRYCGVKIDPGKTHQIRVGRNEFDFKVEDTLVECHSILPFKLKTGLGDFKNADEYNRFRKLRDELGDDKELRKEYLEEVKHLLASQYRESREAILRTSPEYRRSELVVITTPEEFYHMVLKRFAVEAREIPSIRTFENEFESVKATIKQANPETGRRYNRSRKRKDSN